jgi:Response regulator containing CheY-like receiver, AAA-type ATPase, and DNA-binding domains
VAPLNVLIIDDERNIRHTLRVCIESLGGKVGEASSAETAIEVMGRTTFDMAFLDLKLGTQSGLDLIPRLLAENPNLTIVVITAYATIETAVEAMRRGAWDYLPKPFTPAQIRHTLDRILKQRSLATHAADLESQLSAETPDILLASAAPSVRAVMDMVARAAQSDAAVLFRGENGTGKGVLARALHKQSKRAERPFVLVNCPTLSEELLASELFGHAKGAFTGATSDRKGRFVQADKGTLFLDEIAELPLDLQTRLLRVLQEKVLEPVGSERSISLNVRVLAATNQPLEDRVKAGQFRQDLFYRLNVVPLLIPPLRERKEDILPLARHFLAKHSGGREWQIPLATAERLVRMPWPGNVRELENLCQRAALLAGEPVLSDEFLTTNPAPATEQTRLSLDGIELPRGGVSLVDLERAILVRALEMNDYNQSSTARFLRIPRHILLYRMQKFEIPARGKA